MVLKEKKAYPTAAKALLILINFSSKAQIRSANFYHTPIGLKYAQLDY